MIGVANAHNRGVTARLRRTCAALAAFIAWLAGAGTVDAAEPCRIARLAGEAQIVRAGAAAPLMAGAVLRAADRIVTAGGGRVEVMCPDGSSLVIGEATEVELIRFQSDDAPGNALVRLARGILRAVLPQGHRWQGFDVVTRTAVASVRSTAWIVEAMPENTAVFVIEGGVLVSSRANQAQVHLSAGEGTDVALGQGPKPAARWGAARANSVLMRTQSP
ncbi:MAG TPA: FecR family protein [Alphaproteobacteria bacterium]|nr:FecR family protein [Alphaproteobacteria bacterium]